MLSILGEVSDKIWSPLDAGVCGLCVALLIFGAASLGNRVLGAVLLTFSLGVLAFLNWMYIPDEDIQQAIIVEVSQYYQFKVHFGLNFFPAIALACSALMIVFRKRQSPVQHRRCLGCGYDLRATEGACPECGQLPIQNESSAGGWR